MQYLLEKQLNNFGNKSDFFPQIVFLSVVFGLFHGLVFLPVVLALFGKSDDDTADDNGNKSNKESDIEKDNAVINDNKAQRCQS